MRYHTTEPCLCGATDCIRCHPENVGYEDVEEREAAKDQADEDAEARGQLERDERSDR